MGDPKHILHGDNCPVTVLIGNTPFDQSDLCKSISIEPRYIEHMDKHLGRKRDRLDEQVRGWDVKMEFDHADNVMFKAWRERQAAREANRTIPSIAIAITYEMRDGTSETWVLQRCIAKPNKSIGGAEENATMSWDIKAEDYEQSL